MKKCSKCEKHKNLDEFYRDKRSSQGVSAWCVECQKNYFRTDPRRKTTLKKYRATERCKTQQKHAQRKLHLKTKFNMSVNDYENMMLKQNSNCAICGINQSEISKKLCIDHCHQTGKIRGLLCNNCNSGIGMFNDSITLLASAKEYLKRNS